MAHRTQETRNRSYRIIITALLFCVFFFPVLCVIHLPKRIFIGIFVFLFDFASFSIPVESDSFLISIFPIEEFVFHSPTAHNTIQQKVHHTLVDNLKSNLNFCAFAIRRNFVHLNAFAMPYIHLITPFCRFNYGTYYLPNYCLMAQ